MRTMGLLLAVVAATAGCIWKARPSAAPVSDDPSIVFPPFFERAAVKLEEGTTPYELDGVVLRAIRVAAEDFLPRVEGEQPCWDRQEAYRYRVIRQGDIVFVRIIEDPWYCGADYVAVDTGAKYAISVDGRILRRSIGAELGEAGPGEGPGAAGIQDGGVSTSPADVPVTSPHAPDGGSP